MVVSLKISLAGRSFSGFTMSQHFWGFGKYPSGGPLTMSSSHHVIYNIIIIIIIITITITITITTTTIKTFIRWTHLIHVIISWVTNNYYSFILVWNSVINKIKYISDVKLENCNGNIPYMSVPRWWKRFKMLWMTKHSWH